MHKFTGMWLNPEYRGSAQIWQPWGAFPFMPTPRSKRSKASLPRRRQRIAKAGERPTRRASLVSPFHGDWLSGNSRPLRLKSAESFRVQNPGSRRSSSLVALRLGKPSWVNLEQQDRFGSNPQPWECQVSHADQPSLCRATLGRPIWNATVTIGPTCVAKHWLPKLEWWC